MTARVVASVLLFLAGVLFAGCASTGSLAGDMLLYGPIGGATVYGNAQNDKLVEAGRYPPRGLIQRCQREGLVRSPSGDWVTDRSLVVACQAAAGWRMTADYKWERTEAPDATR